MAGMVAQRPTTTTGRTHSDPTRSSLKAVQANSFRLDAAVERLATQFRPGTRSDPVELYILCISLSRGIDDAILSSDVPSSAQKLATLVKQVCHRQNEPRVQAAVMVLMFSVKNACSNGWFLNQDAEELLILANEVGRSFCSSVDINIEPNILHLVITNVFVRFFPRMKMGNVLVSLKVKPGYGAYPVDFHMSKDTMSDAEKKICLFVVRSDSILTSSCLISPPKVNFLINGIGIHGRVNLLLDTGPQLPTIVNPMLTPGTNILQAIGEFSGNYIIAIGFMTPSTSSEAPALQDYVHSVAAACESDSEIQEGPSHISLNCPISFKRIQTPVKGQLCKHHQCFDFENYIEINSRRPSWRCPQCNQSVCHRDLRIDRNMVKILGEVTENVVGVVLSADGSWKPLMEMNDQTEVYCDRSVGSEQCTSAKPSNNIVYLTTEKSEVNDDTEDRKPFKNAHPVPLEMSNNSGLHNYSSAELPLVSEIGNTSMASQTLTSQAEDDFWSGIFILSPATSSRSASPDISGLPATNSTMTPVPTDAVSPAFNSELVDVRGASQATSSIPQTQSSAPGDLQLQSPQVGNSLTTNEFGRSIPRYVSRNPVVVHTLGAPSQALASLNLSIPNSNSSISSGFPVGGAMTSSEVERQQHFSRSHLNSLSTPDISSSSAPYHANTQNGDHLEPSHIRSPPHQNLNHQVLRHIQSPTDQNWNHQDHRHIRSQPRQVVGLPVTRDSRCSSGNPSQHHSAQTNAGMLQATRRPPTVLESSYIPPARAHHGGTPGTATKEISAASSQNPPLASVQRPSLVARSPPVVPIQLQSSRTGSSLPRTTDGSRASTGDNRGTYMGPGSENWRPTGRMRGSLSGRAYSEALIQLMIRPTQSGQATRPT